MKSIILVLEDSRLRVDWLRKITKGFPHIEVVWTWKVNDFVQRIREDGDRILALIFDHDIPPPPEDDDVPRVLVMAADLRDADGKSGHDAAVEMPELKVPAFIWSVNPVGAANIARSLQGKVEFYEHVPFVYGPSLDSFERDIRRLCAVE